MAFSGTFDYSLDAKNRLTVPAKFRTSLSEKVVLARGTEHCVAVWPARDFEAFVAESLAGMHRLDPKRDRLKRYFFSNSFETELDSAGRVGVPSKLMEHAELTKEVVVNGVDDHLEVWDRDGWSAYNDGLDIAELTADFASFSGPQA